MKKSVIIAISAAVVIIAAAGVYAFRNNLFQSYTTSSTSQADTSSSSYKQFAALKGEEYDKTFLSNMIAHHQGAVDMAKLAQANAKHPELKSMADDIVSAQEKEISDMADWQKQWGYPSSSADNMMDHSAMGMMGDMSDMTAELKGKSGDEFDKVFIEQMIMHHQSAIDMSATAESNASHKEVKDLARNIISAQTKEIAQMKQWQNDWGY